MNINSFSMSSKARPALGRCLLAMCLPLVAHAAQDCTLAGAPVNPANGSTTEGKTGWMRCVDRETGQLLREEEFRQGQAVGLVRHYQKGKLVKEYSVNERGNRHGRSREFSESGQVLRDETFDQGEVIGLVRRFHDNGKLRRIGFSMPRQGEQAFAEFTPQGRLAELVCATEPRLVPDVDDAALCGFKGPSVVELFGSGAPPRARLTLLQGHRVRQEFLHDNGQPQRLIQLQGEQRTEQRFSPTGVKLREQQYRLQGSRSWLEMEQVFSDSGTLISDKRWNQGEPTSERTYYLNGQLRHQSVYSQEGSKRLRQASDYGDDGKLTSERRYQREGQGREVPVGIHKVFDTQGRLQSESHFDAGGRLQSERRWDHRGQLVSDEAVFEDGSRKAHAR